MILIVEVRQRYDATAFTMLKYKQHANAQQHYFTEMKYILFKTLH